MQSRTVRSSARPARRSSPCSSSRARRSRRPRSSGNGRHPRRSRSRSRARPPSRRTSSRPKSPTRRRPRDRGWPTTARLPTGPRTEAEPRAGSARTRAPTIDGDERSLGSRRRELDASATTVDDDRLGSTAARRRPLGQRLVGQRLGPRRRGRPQWQRPRRLGRLTDRRVSAASMRRRWDPPIRAIMATGSATGPGPAGAGHVDASGGPIHGADRRRRAAQRSANAMTGASSTTSSAATATRSGSSSIARDPASSRRARACSATGPRPRTWPRRRS